MTAYEDTVELTGKGNVENTIELLASIELTGKGDIPIGGFPGSFLPWGYRKPITLNNGGNAQSNYQILITLTTANFDYAKCKNDGGDIRFAASNGSTPLPYLIKDWNYNGVSKIWVKVDSIPSGENICLYIYYGKADATSEGNGGNVFIPFDNFNDNQKTGWSLMRGTDDFIEQNQRMELSTENQGTLSKGSLATIPLIIEYKGISASSGSNPRCPGFGFYTNASKFFSLSPYTSAIASLIEQAGYEYTVNLNNGNYPQAETDYKIIYTGSKIEVWVEGTKKADISITLDPTIFPAIQRRNGGASGEREVSWDLFKARKYATPEPTPTIGEEQTGISFCTLTLSQSAEIEGKGDLIAFRSYQDLVELTATGNISADAIWAQHELLELTGVGYIFYGPYTDWTYKRGVKAINYTGGELTDYPVEVVLTTENFDYAKCELDGSDIRFGAGNDALSYWIEDWNYNGTSRIWVKASTIIEGVNVSFYIYYGKAGEESESNGDNVWNVVFDHFTGDTLDPTKWGEFGTPTSSLTVTVQDGYVHVNSVSYQSRAVGIKSINEIGSSYRILSRLKFGSLHWGSYYNFWNAIGQSLDASNLNSVFFWQDQYGANPPNIRHASRAAGSWSFAEYQINDYDWHRYLNKKLDTSHHKTKQDAESELGLTSNVYSGTAPFRILHQHDNTYLTTHNSYMDYVAITDKYATPDPIASLVPEEEEEEISLIARWTLSQSAEIEGKGDPTCLLSFQPLLEPVATGDISVDTISAFHELHEFTGVGDFLPLHSYIFSDIDSFLIEGWSVSKTIQDVLWKFSGGIDKLTTPTYFKNFVVTADDHQDPPVNHVIFLGFIPGASYVLATVADKAILNAFDYGWYLSSQFVPLSIRITDEDMNPADTIKTLLGGVNWMSTTGIEPYQIRNVTDWTSIKKEFIFDSKTSKWKVIKEICEYTHHVFMVKWRKTDNDEYYSVAYFVHEDEIDTYLDLPTMETINLPDPYLMQDVKIEDKQEAKYNRVTVNGVDKISGTWYTKTIEAASVTSEDELPIEHVYESTDLGSQSKVDAKATELYNFFHTIARIYTASFKKRMDLELYQKIKFVGYDKIEEEEMRIVGITYRRSAVEDIVTIQFTPDQKLADLRKLMRSMGADFMTEQQRIQEDFFIDLTKIAVGEVTEINGNEAIVKLEKDEGLVKARIINP